MSDKDRRLEFVTNDLQLKIMEIRSALKIKNMNDLAVISGIQLQTLYKIARAPYPEKVRIRKYTRHAIEKLHDCFCGVMPDGVAKMSEYVRFDELIRRASEKGVTVRDIADGVGAHENTIHNYKGGGAEPSYTRGVRIIKYLSNHLTKGELEQAGVICD